MKINLFLWLVWTALIAVLLTLPGSAIPQQGWMDGLHIDKIVHLGLFAVWVWLAGRVFLKSIGQGRSLALLRILAGAGFLYGTAMEFVQHYWIPNRSFDGWDMLADGLGCVFGFWFSRWMAGPAEKSKPL